MVRRSGIVSILHFVELTCWIYILKKHKQEMLELPLLAEYDSEGDHGRPYIPRHEREDLNSYYSDVKSS